jgi:ABC-type taurine transport system ATPase subunit
MLMTSQLHGHLLLTAAIVVLAGVPGAALQQSAALDDAKRLFYNAQYRA